MRISARADYAVRAVVEVAAASPSWVKADQVATAQEIPLKFLEQIMSDLRRAGIIASRRGAAGGYGLVRPATEVSIASIVRAVDGPLAWVRDDRPGAVSYPGHAAPLREVWVAVRACLRGVLDNVTVADILADQLPPHITEVLTDPAVWDD